MANTILLKKSSTANAVPLAANLALGEVALNYTDGNLFYKDGGGTVNLLVSNKFVSVTGNITGGNLVTSGVANVGSLSTAGNITGGNILGGANVNATTHTGTTVSVTGNVTGGNLNAAGLSLSSNVVSALNLSSSLTAATTISAVGNVNGGNLNATGLSLSGNVVSALVSAANITTTANVAASYFIGNGSQLTGLTPNKIFNGTSEANIGTSSGNANISIGGTSNVAVFTTAGLNITGVVSASGNITGGNLITSAAISAASVSASANITGGNLNAAGLSLSSNVVSALNLSSSLTAATNIVAIGNVTGGNIITAAAVSAASVSASGNITGGNILGGANVNATTHTGTTVSVTGNITGGNLNAAGLSLSSNVVSALNLSSSLTAATTVVAIGNITGGNLITSAAVSAASVSASGNITGGNVNTNTLVGTATTVKSTGDLNLSATGNVVLNSKYINGVLTPVQDADAANKGYVDSIAQGLDPKASVAYATAAALPAYTYNNGTAGVGATITANAVGALSIDGSTPTVQDRVLIKNETSTNQPYNGIYVVTTVGSVSVSFVLTRSTDFDAPAEIPSAFTFVETGSTNADTGWVCTTNAPVTVGTTNIVFAQFSGAGSYTANTSAGLSLTGTVFSAKIDGITTAFDGGGNIIVKTSANLTTPNIGAATGTSLSVTGNITGANVNTGGLSLSGNILSPINSTSTIITSANITGGNISATNHTGTTVSVTGNVTGGNVLGTVVYSGGVQVLTINDTVDGGTY